MRLPASPEHLCFVISNVTLMHLHYVIGLLMTRGYVYNAARGS